MNGEVVSPWHRLTAYATKEPQETNSLCYKETQTKSLHYKWHRLTAYATKEPQETNSLCYKETQTKSLHYKWHRLTAYATKEPQETNSLCYKETQTKSLHYKWHRLTAYATKEPQETNNLCYKETQTKSLCYKCKLIVEFYYNACDKRGDKAAPIVLAFRFRGDPCLCGFVDEVHQFGLDDPVHRTGTGFCSAHECVDEVVVR